MTAAEPRAAAEPQPADGVAHLERAESAESEASAEGGVTVDLFYAGIVNRAELVRAMAVKGVDQEIGLLRVTFRDHVRESPGDLELMIKSIGLIVRATQARYRMSAQSSADLVGAITRELGGIADQIMPKEDDYV